MTAAAPARKHAPAQSDVARLMTEMGSSKGFDPMPPDQYLYFLGKKEPPLQRLLALVRACTIQRGRRSPYCVDENGKTLRPADLERALGMEHGNFKRTWNEAVARGLIRLGGRDGAQRAQRVRIYLSGNVLESTGYKEGEEKGGVCTDPLRFLSLTQRKMYAGWPEEQQERFYADFDAAVNFKLQAEREAIAMGRYLGDRALDQVFVAHSLPKTRLATAPPQPKLLQFTLVADALPQQNGSVQTLSVQTRDGGSVHTPERGSAPTSPSLLSLEKTEGAAPSSSSVVDSSARAIDDDETFKAVAEWMRNYARETGKDLGEPDRGIVRRVIQALNGASLQDLEELSIRLFACGLGPRRTYGWFVTVVEEEFREYQTKAGRAHAAAGTT